MPDWVIILLVSFVGAAAAWLVLDRLRGRRSKDIPIAQPNAPIPAHIPAGAGMM